ncbi:MAG: AAA family ATPase [Oscillibacter sp.]|nr:AAA family ATPase [Oscillibacter sp.]
MGKNPSDDKDALIMQQFDLLHTMTQNNMRRMGADFWGKPANAPEVSGTPAQPGAAPQSGGATNAPQSGGTPDNAPQSSAQSGGAAVENGAQAEEVPPPESMEDLQKELDGYIGLEAVKKEVRSLIDLVKVHKMRRENDLPEPDLSLHMVFTGNPGTGKTTIARLMSRIYRSLGILSKGQLVETDRSGLVAGYVGQTALKTSKVIEKAIGGVLFIDEAYTLSGKGESDFGQEAIDTLLKAMEDRRDDLIVIVAGYDELMDGFIHSNPGLESRFNRYLHFDDYTNEELLDMFKMRCDKGKYTLSEEAERAAKKRLEAENGPTFGNGRGVRNLFERVLVRQAGRLAAKEGVTKEELMELKPEDFESA